MSYIVFAVENADRLTLMGPPIAGQSTFKLIALSFIQAPKQTKRVVTGEFGPEEPCAYDAAELIRSTFIGKPVKFKEDYVIDALKRSAGRLTLSTGEDASQMLLSAGYATVPDRIPPHMDRALFTLYSKLMSEARTSQKGIFAPDAAKHVRQLRNYTVDELTKLANQLTGKEELIRVERVLSGTVIIISSAEVLGPTQVATHMTGVSSKEVELSEIAAQSKLHTERFLLHRNVKVHFDGVDAFGNILISVVSSKGTFQEELLSRGFATVNHTTLALSSRVEEMQNAENSAKNERKGIWKHYEEPTEGKKVVVVAAVPAVNGSTTGAGTGRRTTTAADSTTTTAAMTTNNPIISSTTATITAAATTNSTTAGSSLASKVKSGIIATRPDGSDGVPYTGPVQFTGILVQAVHGDTLVIRDDDTHQLIRVSLAGVRTSKNIVRDKDGRAAEARVTYHECAWEAREFVRSHFIGDRVHVKVECARIMPETQEIRPSATVTIPEKSVDIGIALIESGYATFFLGKNDVCASPELLHGAEEDARESMKGQFANPPPRPVTVVELSHLGETRARHYLSFLQRGMQGNRPPVLRGVVDMLIGPSSLRVYVAKENFQIPVKIAGVITPNAAINANDKADPFAEEARDFVIRLLQQREVNVQVFTSDRVGNFICSVCLLDGTNASVALVSAGLATVGNADKLPFVQQLIDAEEEAQEAKRCIWSGSENRPQRSIKMENEFAMSSSNKASTISAINANDESAAFAPYTISEVAEDGVSVYLQSSGPDATESLRKMQGLINRTASQAEYIPRRNELVITQYAEDKTWCRARVRYVQRESESNGSSSKSTTTTSGALVEVLFIDYGNVDTVHSKKVRSIPTTPEYSVVRETAPLAHHAWLAFISPHLPSDAYETATCDAIYNYAEGEVLAKPIYKDAGNNNSVYYTITVDEKMPSLSETLLQAGLALLDRRVEHLGLAEYKKHEAAKEIARKNHKGLWEYGDVDDDETDKYEEHQSLLSNDIS